jgi:hypothetical protein
MLIAKLLSFKDSGAGLNVYGGASSGFSQHIPMT